MKPTVAKFHSYNKDGQMIYTNLENGKLFLVKLVSKFEIFITVEDEVDFDHYLELSKGCFREGTSFKGVSKVLFLHNGILVVVMEENLFNFIPSGIKLDN